MKTVPDTNFTADSDEYKLVLNLLVGVKAGLKRNNRIAALRDLRECESIIKRWPLSSLAGHMYKRIVEEREMLESKSKI